MLWVGASLVEKNGLEMLENFEGPPLSKLRRINTANPPKRRRTSFLCPVQHRPECGIFDWHNSKFSLERVRSINVRGCGG